MKNKYIQITGLTLLCVLNFFCKKDFLDKKPDIALVVPTTLDNYRALLNNVTVMESTPSMGEIASDDQYCAFARWQAATTATERNAYIWANDVYQGETVPDWESSYKQIFYANVVLDGLKDIPVTDENRQEWNTLKGSALFFRAYVFYNLSQIFAGPYDPSTADAEPGIILKLSSNVNEKPGRASIAQTYDQIIKDLKEALTLLPDTVEFKTWPTKSAGFALLARTFLTMQDYTNAEMYSKSCLDISGELMDYNELDMSKTRPFELFNKEVIYHSTLLSMKIISASQTTVDTLLYQSYDDNDLRKTAFFKKDGEASYSFRGSYTGTIRIFSGLTTDEMFLVHAECLARKGNAEDAEKAMEELNGLLITRWKTGAFIPFSANDAEEALRLILKERRKELIFRGTRWTDLRRLNKEPEFAITLTRNLNGKIYTLPPLDKRYVFPIPDAEMKGSELVQNPR